jgi:nucleoside-diphosphate-sugar epimerase
MKSVALIGANGFVGRSIHQELLKTERFQVEAVTRENYSKKRKKEYDYVINAAMPSARFWAKNNPKDDFIETVEKTATILYEWDFNKFIQISTISARTERNTIYGKHKAAAEALCDTEKDLIVRLSAMYSETLQKGVLIDILNGTKVYVDKKSRYPFVSLAFASQWIVDNLDAVGIHEIGARNTISLEQIAAYFNLTNSFEGRVDIQEIENPSSTLPEAKDVLVFLEKRMKKNVQNSSD